MNKLQQVLLAILLSPIFSFSQATDTLSRTDKEIKEQVNQNHIGLLWKNEKAGLAQKIDLKIKSTTKKVIIPNNATDSAYFYNTSSLLLTSKAELTIQLNDYFFMQHKNKTVAKLLLHGPRLMFSDKNFTTDKVIELKPQKAKRLLNKLIKMGICELPDDTKWGIDGKSYVTTISTPSEYRQYSYWSPSYSDSKNANQFLKILNLLTKSFNEKKEMDKIYQNLPSGEYTVGMNIGMIADGFLPDNIHKSSAYQIVEKIMKEKMGISNRTHKFHMPLLIIN